MHLTALRNSSAVLLACALAAGCASTDAGEQALGTYVDALAAAREKEFDKAVELANQAREEQPGFMDPLVLIGRIREHRGDFEGAREVYREVLSIDPTHTPAGVDLALTYLKEDRLQEGHDALIRALDCDPGSEHASFNLGSLARQLGRPADAAEWYRLSASFNNHDVLALAHRASILDDLGESDAAWEAVKRAVRRVQNSEEGTYSPHELQAVHGIYMKLKAERAETPAP